MYKQSKRWRASRPLFSFSSVGFCCLLPPPPTMERNTHKTTTYRTYNTTPRISLPLMAPVSCPPSCYVYTTPPSCLPSGPAFRSYSQFPSFGAHCAPPNRSGWLLLLSKRFLVLLSVIVVVSSSSLALSHRLTPQTPTLPPTTPDTATHTRNTHACMAAVWPPPPHRSSPQRAALRCRGRACPRAC